MTTDKTGAEVTVTHNPDDQRYEISAEGRLAGFTQYRDRTDDPDAVERVFFHTEVSDEFAGRGLATILVREALDATRDAGLTIVGVCPLVAAFLKKNPDYAPSTHPVTPQILAWLKSVLP
ncbi:GNAT family N-acetyltransferase [Gordonia sp. NPDC003585]|uniref:GNAT family N-acetyltransferase n=1 Tax=Gordonia sp. NPDC003585 TaxID=3154275 RepID=UPI0033AC6AB9